jgi:uncharacterized protein YcfJ
VAGAPSGPGDLPDRRCHHPAREHGCTPPRRDHPGQRLAAGRHRCHQRLGRGRGASLGAIVGDSIGYAIGRRGGRALLERFGRRFPKHFGPPHLARAERIFEKWGVWAVFFGRFVALLRILAGPLAGALRVPYRKFLVANAAGGILWSFGTAFAIYYAGRAAEKYLRGFSWIALVVAVLFGIGTTLYLRRRAARTHDLLDDDDPSTNPRPRDEVTTVAVDAARDTIQTAKAAVRNRTHQRRRPPRQRRRYPAPRPTLRARLDTVRN